MGTGLVCAKCGQRIIGVSKRAYGKTYCAGCYEELVATIEQSETEKKELMNYICKLFALPDCPSDAEYAIDAAVRDGKKISGVRGTLYYYFEILGHSADANAVHSVNYIIKTEYDNAHKYFIRQRNIKEQNAKVDLNLPPVTIKIDLNRKTKENKISFRIEDL